jgi:hypothetical protein
MKQKRSLDMKISFQHPVHRSIIIFIGGDMPYFI